MGGSASSFSSIDVVNKSLSNIIMTNESIAKTESNNTNSATFGDIDNECGTLNITVDQDIDLKQSLNSINENLNSSDIINQLKNDLSNEAESKLSGIAFGDSNATAITNLVNDITTNVDLSNLSSCVASETSQNFAKFGNIRSKCVPGQPPPTSNINVLQNIVIDQIATCNSKNTNLNKICNTIDNTVKNKAKAINEGIKLDLLSLFLIPIILGICMLLFGLVPMGITFLFCRGPFCLLIIAVLLFLLIGLGTYLGFAIKKSNKKKEEIDDKNSQIEKENIEIKKQEENNRLNKRLRQENNIFSNGCISASDDNLWKFIDDSKKINKELKFKSDGTLALYDNTNDAHKLLYEFKTNDPKSQLCFNNYAGKFGIKDSSDKYIWSFEQVKPSDVGYNEPYALFDGNDNSIRIFDIVKNDKDEEEHKLIARKYLTFN